MIYKTIMLNLLLMSYETQRFKIIMRWKITISKNTFKKIIFKLKQHIIHENSQERLIVKPVMVKGNDIYYNKT